MSFDWLVPLRTLRMEIDAKISHRKTTKPKDKLGIDVLRAKRNGIQSCINELHRLDRIAARELEP